MTTMTAAMDRPAQDLQRAKESVRAAISKTPGGAPPPVRSRTPIKAMPADLAAKAQARAQAGFDPIGADSPSSAMIKKIVLPSAVLALLDAILLIVALVSGNTAPAIVAAALLVLFAGAAFAGRRTVAADDLRLSALDRIAVVNAGRWSSSQQWTGPVASTPECALVVAAARAAQRVVVSRAWVSGELIRRGVPLAVGAELDQLDANAMQLATHRHPQLPGEPLSTPELDDAWDKTLTRVAALTAYADTLDGRSDLTDAEVNALAFFLSASIYDT